MCYNGLRAVWSSAQGSSRYLRGSSEVSFDQRMSDGIEHLEACLT